MIIREADPVDAAAIELLYQSFVRNPSVQVLPERISAVRADPTNFLFVAEVEGRVVGTVHVTMCMDAMFGHTPYAVVENVIVAPEQRGRGTGHALMARAEDVARAAGCTKLMLLSSAERVEAHRFFVRAGYDEQRKKGFVKYLGYPQPRSEPPVG